MRTVRTLVLMLSLPCACALPLPAQQLDCVVPTKCMAPNRIDRQLISVRLTSGGNAVQDATVMFVRTAGVLAESVKTDGEGVAQAVWTGDTGNGLVTIIASAVVNGKLVADTIKLGQAVQIKPQAWRQ